MDATSPRWQAITDSEFPGERDALAFVRERLPDHDPRWPSRRPAVAVPRREVG